MAGLESDFESSSQEDLASSTVDPTTLLPSVSSPARRTCPLTLACPFKQTDEQVICRY